MTRSVPRYSLFAVLRRDSLLFAIVGMLVLALHAFQPLAQAHAATNGHYDVICSPSSDGTSGKPRAPNGEDCRQCIAGPCAGFISAAPSFVADAISFPARLDETPPAGEVPAISSRLPGDPPPATRAPPLSA